MTYVLSAVIARLPLLRARSAGRPVVELGQGLGLLPVTRALVGFVDAAATDTFGFRTLPSGLLAAMADWSGTGPVACVETEYFGGTGEQRSVVWDGGKVVLGPLYKGEKERFPAEGSPISQALRRLGVSRGEHFDEFDAVGLRRHRRTEDWLSTE